MFKTVYVFNEWRCISGQCYDN